MKPYLNPSSPDVEPVGAHVADAAAEQTRFDQDTARRAKILRCA